MTSDFRQSTLARLLAAASLVLLAACDPELGEDADASTDDPPIEGEDAGSGPDVGFEGPPVEFTLTTWNVHDFFDTFDTPGKRDEVPSTSQLNTKLNKLSTVINRAKPDILALQEVETEALMAQLGDKLTIKLPNRAFRPSDDPRNINVGLMSRFPITSIVSHKDEQFYDPEGYARYAYSRDSLEVHLDLGGGRSAVVLVNHQISQLEDTANTERKRQAQAKHTREIADGLRAQDPRRPVFITGDMNDDVGTASMNLYLDGGAWTDIGAQVPSGSRYTYLYGSKKYRFDYVLPNADAARWLNSISILHGSDVDSGSSAPSDHSPVTAKFTFP